jgi:hypothetical protein
MKEAGLRKRKDQERGRIRKRKRKDNERARIRKKAE